MLGLFGLLYSDLSVKCPAKCVDDVSNDIATAVANSKLGLPQWTKELCLASGGRTNSTMVSQNTGANDRIVFVCGSVACSGGSPALVVTEKSIIAIEKSYFIAQASCTAAAEIQNCIVSIKDQ